MFKNYLKIALRNFSRNKAFTFINILGLAIGMAVCIMLLLWVQNEFSYDKFHTNSDQIYSIIQEGIWNDGETYGSRTNISLWIFLVSGVLALVIALITVSVQTLRSAHSNPVEALKYE